jgi:hypothetical protein
MIYVREHVACQECEGGATISVDWQSCERGARLTIIARSLSFPVRAPCVGSDYIVGGGGVARFAGYFRKIDRWGGRLLTQTIRNALFVIETVPYWGCCCCLVAGMGWDAGVVLREVCWD